MNAAVVMLIEADVVIRTPLAEYLRECGYRVAEVFNVTEARDILAHAPVSVDMILMDVDAPEENGFVFRAWVRAHYPEVEVILAGSIERTVTKAGDLCEEGPALPKPYDHKFVLDEIPPPVGGAREAPKGTVNRPLFEKAGRPPRRKNLFDPGPGALKMPTPMAQIKESLFASFSFQKKKCLVGPKVKPGGFCLGGETELASKGEMRRPQTRVTIRIISSQKACSHVEEVFERTCCPCRFCRRAGGAKSCLHKGGFSRRGSAGHYRAQHGLVGADGNESLDFSARPQPQRRRGGGLGHLGFKIWQRGDVDFRWRIGRRHEREGAGREHAVSGGEPV